MRSLGIGLAISKRVDLEPRGKLPNGKEFWGYNFCNENQYCDLHVKVGSLTLCYYGVKFQSFQIKQLKVEFLGAIRYVESESQDRFKIQNMKIGGKLEL